jgi:hypothetical protein
MKRELIDTRENGDMLVVDSWIDMFGVPYFQGGIITTELRPTTICKRLGGGTSRAEAIAALSAAGQPEGGR